MNTSSQKATASIQRGAFIPHARVQMEITGPSLAKQSFADECNINNIMAKFQKTGLIEHVKSYGAHYGDLPSALDYHTALNQAIEAKEAFASLPSGIRNQFQNDPAQFLAFVEDPENQEAMIEMGLAHATPDTLQVAAPKTPDPDPEDPDPETKPPAL